MHRFFQETLRYEKIASTYEKLSSLSLLQIENSIVQRKVW